MWTVLIILLGLIPIAIFVLLLRSSRAATWSEPEEIAPEDPPDYTVS